jgi:capsular exopolysaccharide synthesis family protein
MNSSDTALPAPRGLRLASREDELEWDRVGYIDEDQPGIDLSSIVAVVVRNRWIIALILFVCLMGGLAASMLTVPLYRASASVQIEQRTAKVLGTEDEETYSSSAEADRYLQTQVDVIRSRALAIKVADELRLTTRNDFLTAMGIDREAVPTPQRLRLAVLNALQGSLSVTLPNNSRMVTIAFASRSPDVSAEIANAFVRGYIESNLQRRFDQSSYARNFLSGQLAQAKARLEQSELAANAYARQERLIDASQAASAVGQGQAPRSITAADLVQLNQVYNQAQATRLQTQEQWQRARATPLASVPEVLANPAVQELSRRRAELLASYQQERQRHKEDYPTVRQAQAAIDEIDRQIRIIGTSVLNSIRYSYETAANQERAFARRIDQLKSATLSEQDRSVRYNILKREADTNRELYEGLLQRFREISAASGATNNNVAVIDRAEPPTRPFAPRPMVNLALASLLGLTLSIAAVFMRERLDDAIRDPEDTERKLGLPLLGIMPRTDVSNLLDELSRPRSPLIEAAQALQISLELSSNDGMPDAVLISSSRQGEGKSTTAALLAAIMAQSGKRVALVDADLRKPSLHRYLGHSNDLGLSTLLAGQASLEAVLHDTNISGLSLLPSGPIPPNPAQLLGSTRLADYLRQLQTQYDRVIIDAPPVLGLADAPRLASVVKGVIFVVEADRAHRGGAKAALKRLSNTRAFVLGAVLTKFSGKVGADNYEYYGYGVKDTILPY